MVLGRQHEHGDVVHYEVVVTNNGNTTVDRVIVSELVTGAGTTPVALTCEPANRIAVQQTVLCQGEYVITASDVDSAATRLTAVATATGTNRGGAGDPVAATPDTATTSLTTEAALTTAVTAGAAEDSNGSGRTDAGDQVRYTVTITNSGTVSLTGVTPALTMASPAGPGPTLTCESTALAPGSSLPCTGVYVLTQADVDHGGLTATATATGVDRAGHPVSSGPDTEVTALDRFLELITVKTVAGVHDADHNGTIDAGDTLDYAIAVTNTGNVSLKQVTVTDELAPDVSCAPTDLAPGGLLSCTTSYVVTPADVDTGRVTNTATAKALGPDDQAVTSNPSAVSSDLNQVAALAITKTVSGVTDTNHNSATDVGDVIAYDVTVTNSGTVTLSGVAVAGESTALHCTPETSTLAAGVKLTCTGSYPITQADVDHGSVTNTATASGTGPGDTTVHSGPAVVTTQLTGKPGLTVTNKMSKVKDKNNNGVIDAGDVLTYTVTATNTGSVSLSAVAAAEAAGIASPTLTCTPEQPAALAPGDSMTCTGTYKVTTADAAQGFVSADATATGTTPAGAHIDAKKATVRTTVKRATTSPTTTTTTTGTPGASGSTGGSGGSGGSGNLAYTGVDLAPKLISSAVLLVAGIGLVLLTRRRRT